MGILCLLTSVLALVLTTAFWAWALADVLRHEPNDGWAKLVWAYVVLLTPPWGGLAYVFARRPERLREYGE